jgi:beta-aspartyl-peptidase (threonine type)
MLVVGCPNAKLGLVSAMEVLRAGGSALDAVETGVRMVEADEDESSVGVGGMPNLVGELELDASIMDGATLKGGAVAALVGYPYPISVARQVLERLPYDLLVGQGAAWFAQECGFEAEETQREPSVLTWRERLTRMLDAEQMANLSRRTGMIEATQAMWESIRRGHGTTDVIAIDGQGNVASGVSTAGLALKYPGRVGDSPIIGAGNYADNRYGAAACTGYGELAMRCGTARSAVLYLKMGMTLERAVREAMSDLRAVPFPVRSSMNMVAVDTMGHHAAGSSREGSTYCYMTHEMDVPVEAERIFVPLG